MECRKTLTFPFLALYLLLTGCERECCLPGGCDRCNGDSRLLVRAILPEGCHAESFTLEYGRTHREFYGSSTLIHEHLGITSDILIYNNDCENVFLDGNLATTRTEHDCDTIHQMPDQFLSYAVQDTLIATDTVSLYLQPRVYAYNVHVTLEDNDGRVIGCPLVILNGCASGFDIRRGTLSSRTSHRASPIMTDNEVFARMTSWGFSDSPGSLTLVFRQPHGLCRYDVDISDQTDRQPKGGDIHVTINVSNEIEEITAEGGGDMTIDLDNWNEEDTVIIV